MSVVGSKPKAPTAQTHKQDVTAKPALPATTQPAPAPPTVATSQAAQGFESGRAAGQLIAPLMDGSAQGVASKMNAKDATASRSQVNTARVLADISGATAQAAPARKGGAAKPLDAALASGNAKEAGAVLAGQSNADKLKTLGSVDKAQLQPLVEGVRSGAITDPKVAMAINLEQLGRTSWGRKNGDEVENLREKFKDNKVSFSADPDGPTGNVAAWAFTDKDGNVALHQDLMRHPELATASLANEAVHSEITAKGKPFPEYLTEETRSTVAEAQVWGELRGKVKDNSHAAAKDTESNHAIYAAGGEAAVRAETAAVYAHGNALAGKWDRVQSMVDGLAGHKDSQKKMVASQGKQLGEAAARLAQHRGDLAAKNSPGDADKVAEAKHDAMDNEMKRLAKALKGAPKEVVAAANAAVESALGEVSAAGFQFYIDAKG